MSRRRGKCLALKRKCDKCTLRFSSHFCLFLHLQNHEKVYSGWFRCFRCKKQFKTILDAVKHRERHLSIRAKQHQKTKDCCSQENQSLKEDNVSIDSVKSDKELAAQPILKTTSKEELAEKCKENKEMFAIKFVEQLKAALKLDKDFSTTDREDLLQISEVSSSGNLQNSDTLSPASSNSFENLTPDIDPGSSKDQDIISTSCEITQSKLKISTNNKLFSLSESEQLAEETLGKSVFLNSSKDVQGNFEGSLQDLTEYTSVREVASPTESIQPGQEPKPGTDTHCNSHVSRKRDSSELTKKVIPTHEKAATSEAVNHDQIPILRHVDSTVVNNFAKRLKSSPGKTMPVLSPFQEKDTSSCKHVTNVSEESNRSKHNTNKVVVESAGKPSAREEKEDILNEDKASRKYACSFCTAKFACFSRLRRHKRIVHNKQVAISSDYRFKGPDPDELKEKDIGLKPEIRMKQNLEKNSHQRHIKSGPYTSEDHVNQASGKRSLSGLIPQNMDVKKGVDGNRSSDHLELKDSHNKHFPNLISQILAVKNSGVGNSDSGLFKCKICHATFLTSYGEQQHMLKRHSMANDTTGIDKVPLHLKSVRASKCNAETQTQPLQEAKESIPKAVICNQCGCRLHCVKQQNIHMLEKHGLEVTFDNETFAFVVDQPLRNCCQKMDQSASSTDIELDKNYIEYGGTVCQVCDTNFSSWYNMKRHMFTKHDILVKKSASDGESAQSLYKRNLKFDKVAVGTGIADQPSEIPCQKKDSSCSMTDPEVDKNYIEYDGTICQVCYRNFSSWHAMKWHMVTRHDIFVKKSDPDSKNVQSFDRGNLNFDNPAGGDGTADQLSENPFQKTNPHCSITDPEVDKNYIEYDGTICQVCYKNFSSWHTMKRHMITLHDILVKKSDTDSKNVQSVDKHELKYDKSAGAAEVIDVEEILPAYRTPSAAKEEKADKKSKSSMANFNNNNKKVNWLADFSRKKFECFTCDFPFSGFFILKKHLKEKHDILLGPNGEDLKDSNKNKNVEQNDKTVTTEKAQEEARGSDATHNPFIQISSVTRDISDVSDTEEPMDVIENNTKNNMLPIARKKNGLYQCPQCDTDFKTLIDRYIHILDNHGKGSMSRTQDKPINSETAPVASQKATTTDSDITVATDGSLLPESYSCSICARSYNHMKALKCHISKAHSATYQYNMSDGKLTIDKRSPNKVQTNQSKIKSSPSDLHSTLCPSSKTLDANVGFPAQATANTRECSPLKHDNIGLQTTHLQTTSLQTTSLQTTSLQTSSLQTATLQPSDEFSCRICNRNFTTWKEKCQHMVDSHNIKQPANTARKSFTPLKKTNKETPKDSATSPVKLASRPSTQPDLTVPLSSTEKSIDCLPSKKFRINNDNGFDTSFECSICLLHYQYKASLMRHIRDKHGAVSTNRNAAGKSGESNTQKNHQVTPLLASVSSKIKDNSPLKKTQAKENKGIISEDPKRKTSREVATVPPTFVRAVGTDQKQKTKNDQGNTTISIVNITEPESYVCTCCNRSFLDFKAFEEHKRRCFVEANSLMQGNYHSTVLYKNDNIIPIKKSYSCEVCESVFDDYDQLQKHRIQGICKLTCPIPGCGEAFVSRSSYENHTQNTCTLCHSKLFNERNLKRHYRDVHKIKNLLSCDLCMEKFAEPIGLAMHHRESHMTTQ